MANLRPAEPGEVKRILEKLGFTCIRQSGSHAVYHHPDDIWATVPIHKGRDLGKGVLSKILKDAKIRVDEYVGDISVNECILVNSKKNANRLR